MSNKRHYHFPAMGLRKQTKQRVQGRRVPENSRPILPLTGVLAFLVGESKPKKGASNG